MACLKKTMMRVKALADSEFWVDKKPSFSINLLIMVLLLENSMLCLSFNVSFVPGYAIKNLYKDSSYFTIKL